MLPPAALRSGLAAALTVAAATEAVAQVPAAAFVPLRNPVICRRAPTAPGLFHFEFGDADQRGLARDITAVFDTSGIPLLLVVFAPDSAAGLVHALGVRFQPGPEGRYGLVDERDSVAADTSAMAPINDQDIERSREFVLMLWQRRCNR